MGTPTEIREPPTRFLIARLGSARRMKRLAVAAVVLVAAAGIGGYVLLKNVEANQAKALGVQWGTLQACVLGDPLKPGETASARVRGVQLTVLGIPRDQRSKPGELGWPASCATVAAGLSERAESAESGGAELKASAAALSKAMRENPNATGDIGKLVDQVWKDARDAKLQPMLTVGTPALARALALFPRDVLHEPSGLAGEFALASLKPDLAPQKALRFLIDENGLVGGAVLCTASGLPTTVSCKHVSAEVAKHTTGLSLEGTIDPDAQPWIFAGDKGQLGIFRPVGTAALAGDIAVGSTVDKDGSDWLLLHRGASTVPTDLELVHAPLTGDVPHGRPALDPGEIDAMTDASLAWDWIVARTGAKGHPAAHLVARKVGGNGDLGPVVDIGDAATLDRQDREDNQPRFSTCRSGSNIALRAHGSRGDLVTFTTGNQWTAPLALTTRGGVMTCRGDEAVITLISRVVDEDGSHPTVEQSRCNASGCTVARLAIREMLSGTDVVPHESGGFTAAEINGKLLVVWSAGALGGLRMRYAALDQLKTTPDELIVDSREDSGQSLVTELRLLPTASGAILFANTTTGARLFNVDGSARLTVLHAHA
jgi:hypothetical protein